ncbi:hydrogenase 4 membrane subunit [Consotaella salsifontis]|uniref:Hydrogenase-4 component E n=1 Tax=Consotaella salsifontis TaxID=1365950 RepID=A0A1T4RN89_9HYPH|nr:hydrogenase 4 membrane subunit [Consotaella salsifontis]SKA17403.1 hydrogenase-4 component E [Consotaella salsifontis]
MQGTLFINGLSGFLIVTALLVALAPRPVQAARFYALQSLVLVALFVSIAMTTGSTELYLWSASAFVTKVVLVPVIMTKMFRRLEDPELGSGAVMPAALSIVGAALIVILCYAVISRVTLPAALPLKPALAISLAHFFLGLGCIVGQRNILKQVFGYCLMENGSHLTLAILAPNAPELVEVGIATDAVFAVVIMAVLGMRISKTLGSLDARKLTTLKG